MFLHLSTLLINECPKFFAGEVLVQGLHSLKELVIEGGGKFNMLAGFQCLTCLQEFLFLPICWQVLILCKPYQGVPTLIRRKGNYIKF